MSYYQTIITSLRQKGYRLTPQREMIIKVIAQNTKHLSAEEIFLELQKHTNAINIATVYRTLDMLWEEGFAGRNDLSEGKIVYSANQHGPHIHLVCRRCNHIINAEPQELKKLGEVLDSRYNFDADLAHISIFGLCHDCRQSN
jgi:Fur family ferric uptake transcriptional regulator